MPTGSVVTDAEADWPRARTAALKRDGYRCQRCGSDDRSDLHVHHRMPRAIRVDHSASNLVTLCTGCHGVVHLNMQVNLARRMMQRWATRVACLVDFNDELPRDELDLTEVLRALGKVRLREGQLPVILAVLKGNDVLAVRPTGSGKSLCFQVPTMLRAGTSLVLEPLKALMKDQVRSLQSLQIPATFISGDLSPKERLARFDLLEQGTWKFVYMAPERFDSSMVRDPSEQARLDRFRPSHLVVDEAHSIAQYGNGFRPFYARCGEIRERLGRPQVVAFTATANPAMQQEICRSLGSPGATIIVESPNRPNIALARVPMGRKDPERFRIMARVLAQVTVGWAMIFVPTVREGEIVQSGLRSHGLDLEFFHSNAGTAKRLSG